MERPPSRDLGRLRGVFDTQLRIFRLLGDHVSFGQVTFGGSAVTAARRVFFLFSTCSNARKLFKRTVLSSTVLWVVGTYCFGSRRAIEPRRTHIDIQDA